MTEAQIAAIAGEHYVAHKIAMLGFLPTLVRQRTPRVDLLVSSDRAGRTVAIQIKSAFHATRESASAAKDAQYELRFPLGYRAINSSTDATFFCFVDLKRLTPMATPDAYIVPAMVLKQEYEGVYFRKYAQMHHQRSWQSMQQYRNNWEPLVKCLSEPEETSPRIIHAPELGGLRRQWTNTISGAERESLPVRLLNYDTGTAG